MLVTVLDDSVLGGLRTVDVEATAWEELDACPVCRTADHLRDVAAVRGARAASVLAACDSCQHVFLRRRPTEAWIGRFYAEEWDAARQVDHGGKVAAPKPPDTKARDFCAAALAPGSTVLDIGAGFGRQLMPLRDDGHHVVAVEPSAHRAAYLEAEGIRWAGPTLEQAALEDPVDLVVIHHVLEHVPDPWRLIERVGEVLAPRGCVYVAVPNLWEELSLQSMHFAPHLSQYTLRSLVALLAHHGFTVERVEEGIELQVLARAGGTPSAPPAGRSAFTGDLARWLAEGFGDGSGRRTIVWRKDPDGQALYRREALPGRRAQRLMALAARAERLRNPRLRASLRKRLPGWTRTRSVRMLSVDVQESTGLPVEVRHTRHEAPVWVK